MIEVLSDLFFDKWIIGSFLKVFFYQFTYKFKYPLQESLKPNTFFVVLH